MARVKTIDLTNITDPTEFITYCSQMVGLLVDAVNGGLDFDQNLNTESVSVVFTAANVDVKVPHQLNKSIVKYIVTSKTAACDVYTSPASAFTSSNIFLRGTAPATVTLELF